MTIAIWPLLLAVAGVLVYALSSNDKVAKIGFVAFAVGLLWLCYGLAGKTLHLG